VGADQHYAGLTYGQWSEAWWDWAALFPAQINPLSDATGQRCGVGQSGPVWFLAGVAFPASSPVTRDCSIPGGKALLIPVVNAECSSMPSDLCGSTTNYATLLANEAPLLVGAGGTVSVDGATLAAPVHAISPPPAFSIFWGPGNPFGNSTGLAASVADGFWYLLRPLTPGKHTVVIHGTAPAVGFSVDVTYHLTVDD
jgi:hypothetical protein